LNNFLSMPNKFLEMVMSRLPIAVSRLGDMAEMIERHRIGTVFDERDPAAIAAAIEGMLAPQVYPELRANVMKAAEEMTWEREGAAYVAAIGALIPASAGSAPVSGPAPAAASRPHP
jgi:glycosyltransferase involved in cell wall biosynthesis